jgi:hypothetical protein
VHALPTVFLFRLSPKVAKNPAYMAETATGILRAGNQMLPVISTTYEQITPEYLRDMNPVKREKIPDKRQALV